MNSRQDAISRDGSVTTGSCATPKEVGVPAGDSAWIPGGEGLAVTPWTVTDRPGGGFQPGHTDVEVIDPNTLETMHFLSRGPRALYARGWSPDGEWLALWSDPENPWRVYLLSRDGFLRGIVPMTNATYVGWFEVE